MGLLKNDLDETKPMICEVDKEYLKMAHKADYRVSVKYNNRKFVGLSVRINGKFFVIPLTSQTTQLRIAEGKKKRSSVITTYVEDSGIEIANLLHNNMIPVPKSEITKIDIDPLIDTYLENEYRYIRKNWAEINEKSMNVYIERYDEKSRNYKFLQRQCCDFKLLEDIYMQWEKTH